MDKSEIRKEVDNILRQSLTKIEELNSNRMDETDKLMMASIKNVNPIDPAVSFAHDTYQPIFQMQPEIITRSVSDSEKGDREFVFGTKARVDVNVEKDKISPKESLELLRKSMESLGRREYNDFAMIFLESVSKLDLKKRDKIKEYQRQVSENVIEEKMQAVEIGEIEKSLKEVEKHLEDILSNKNGESLENHEKKYLQVIQMFCDILSSLFDHFNEETKEKNLNVSSYEIEKQTFTDENTESDVISTGKSEIIYNSVVYAPTINDSEIEKENLPVIPGKNICHCFSTNKESQNVEWLDLNDLDMKKGHSISLERLSFEEKELVHTKSFKSLTSANFSDHALRKIVNEDNLTKVDSTALLKSDESFTKSFELPVKLHVKYPIENNVICIGSIPRIIRNHQYAEKMDSLKKSFKNDSAHSINSESFSNAIIENLNDDEFLDLPKVPSHALTESSTSIWIDENTSFMSVNCEPEIAHEIMKNDSMSFILKENSLNSPFEQSQPSTSVNTDSKKSQNRFCKFRNFLQQLSNAVLRKKHRK